MRNRFCRYIEKVLDFGEGWGGLSDGRRQGGTSTHERSSLRTPRLLSVRQEEGRTIPYGDAEGLTPAAPPPQTLHPASQLRRSQRKTPPKKTRHARVAELLLALCHNCSLC